ncbi:Nitric oxide reductase [bioreactor metagenome]|uniref:Nitric oxide reductase n=1 Tax=bioreactor metagenome TaxID=1076179 RepID=A0A645G0H4_9ZZZZ
MVTFDVTNGVLFSADAFGTFGALDGKLFNDEVNFDRDWIDDARRYLTNIVGKYGPHVQALLKKAGTIDIKIICPLHGPVWRSNLGYFIDKYDHWSRYEPEEKGVMIAYSSMYGNTEAVVHRLAGLLAKNGVQDIRMYDVSKTHYSFIISDIFKYSHIVLASPTYNLHLYEPMDTLMRDMGALNVQNRDVAIIGNGSWAPSSHTAMQKMLEEMKDMRMVAPPMLIKSAMKPEQEKELEEMSEKLVESIKNQAL